MISFTQNNNKLIIDMSKSQLITANNKTELEDVSQVDLWNKCNKGLVIDRRNEHGGNNS